MIKVKQFEFNLFGVHTYLVYDIATKDAAVIDAAMQKPDEMQRFDNYVKENGLKITQIINTHLHLDHCFGIDYVKDKYGVMVKANPEDDFLGKDMDMQLKKFGMRPTGKQVLIDVELKDGDTITLGESTLYVIQVPGHTPGGIAIYSKEGNVLFSGDTLFKGSVGRTDLFGGNHRQLIDSIRNKLFTLPDNTLVLPGHGPHTTIGEEKASNPFV